MISSWNMKTVIVGVGTKNCKWKTCAQFISLWRVQWNRNNRIANKYFWTRKKRSCHWYPFLPFCNLYNWPKKNVRSSFRKLVWHLTWKAKKVCLFINTKNIFTSWTVCCWNKNINKILLKSCIILCRFANWNWIDIIKVSFFLNPFPYFSERNDEI